MANNPLDLIAEHIDSRTSFCFNSGAGSGKTYSLVKTIDYISKKYGDHLLGANQKIMVITYTNAAANEIIRRIGKSRICDISTIHTRLWDLIRRFQTDLVRLHLRKINETIADLEKILGGNLYVSDLRLRNEIETNKAFIREFYKFKSLGASECKMRFSKYTAAQEIPNVSVFINFVSKFDKYSKLVKAKNGIEKGLEGYRRVEYDPFDNSDKLHRMRFSHNTLIDYAEAIIEQNKTIRKVISDKYPFALIDEYQDTAEKVVNIFGSLMPKMTVGFYGDNCQNIYSDGVGDKLFEFLPDLQPINYLINRRSTSKIVDLGNRIRNDGCFLQEPFSQDRGSVEIFYSRSEDDRIIDSFISKVTGEFSGLGVNFFLLKNEQVASKNGFGGFYSALCDTLYYKNNYGQIAAEILSDDETKLGKTPHNFYQFIRLRRLILNGKKSISDYVPDSVFGKMNLHTLSGLIDYLRKACESETFADLVLHFSSLYNENHDAKAVFEKNISDCVLSSFEDYKSYLFESLYGEIADDKIPEAQAVIERVLSTSILEITNWYNYLLRAENKQTSFYTFHGTKGLEFENVGVILTNSFNRKKNYFHSFFEEITSEEKSEDFNAKKNLLYVSVTRAKRNLRVLYLDSHFDSIAQNFNSIFGESKEFVLD